MREYLNNVSIYYCEYVEAIRRDVIKPLELQLSVDYEHGLKLEKEHKKVNSDYIDIVYQLEKAKTKFLSLSQISENSAKDYETAKICMNTTGVERFQIKSISSLKESKDAEKSYIHCLKQANNIRANYIDEMKRILNQMEQYEMQLSEKCKEAFQRYSVFLNAFVTNQHFDIDKLKQSAVQIDIHKDLNNFILKNQKNYIHPSPHEFFPYRFQLKQKHPHEFNLPTEVVLNTIKTLQDNLEIKYDDWNYEEELKKVKVNTIANNAIRGEDVSNEERTLILELLKQKQFRLQFLTSLNNYRIKGQFTISLPSFELIGYILKTILQIVVEVDDFESSKYVIILSQTFKNGDVSLQQCIQNEEILQTRGFWEKMLICITICYLISYQCRLNT